MYVLGLLRVHNGGTELKDSLDALAILCDSVVALEDRSDDGSLEVLQAHHGVGTIVSARSDLPHDPWLIDEATGLELLYRVADFHRPQWIVAVDHDQVVTSPELVRDILEAVPTTVVGFDCTMRSSWNDPLYPDMVPLMSAASPRRRLIWRYRRGLHPGTNALHNGYAPPELEQSGEVRFDQRIVVRHSGWSTLAARMERARLYLSIDPASSMNHGVPYDRGLLFGYAINEVDQLIEEYRRRVASHSRTRS